MARARLHKTLADYVAIAISPVLIMLLVGSLVFFLLQVGYDGQHAGRLQWIVFWFVFASVLIARIAIEQGKDHALVYTAAIWIAIVVVTFRFTDKSLIGLALLGLTWWCAQKLTWDCTLVDDSQDASGQGLMQVAGLEDAPVDDTKDSKAEELQPLGVSNDPEDEDTSSDADPKSRPHAPGLWVVYFSLAALPAFGLGQLLIPSANAEARSQVFRYLWVYVAAGIGLLLTTSFLGLRRYLRQRRLTMPKAVTATWLTTGVAVALGVLVLAVLLPRPNSSYSLTDLVDQVGSKIQQASDYAFGSNDAGEGKGRPVGKADEKSQDGTGRQSDHGKPDNSQGEAKKSGGSNDEKDGGRAEQKSSDNSADSQNGKQQNGEPKQQQPGDNQASGDSSRQSERSAESAPAKNSSIGDWISRLFKWIVYGVLAVAAVVLLIKYRDAVLAGLRKFWNDLMNLLASLFGGRTATRTRAMDAAVEAPVSPPPPFRSFRNPFASGAARSMTLEELLRYTFQALEAWGTEAGFPRRADQTPREYVVRLGTQHPEIDAVARDLGQLYTRAAYSSLPLPPDTAERIAAVWRALEANAPALV